MPSEKDLVALKTRAVAEIITLEELEQAVKKPDPTGYIGFEPSGKAHIAWLMMADKIIDLTQCGFRMTILMADWHAFINDKLGGDMDKIRKCGKYMEDCFTAMGIDTERTKFIYFTDYMSDPKYWELVLRVAKASTLSRVKRALTILGRQEADGDQDTSKLMYPLIQVADIFYLKVDVALGGMDQRHAHMLARDVAPKLGLKPPIAIHTPLNAGLQGGGRMDPSEAKMSKSKPESAIFIHDPAEEVNRKIKNAFCPEKVVEGNPIMDIARNLLFSRLPALSIKRPAKFGGDVQFQSYADLEKAFIDGKLHPADLKKGIADGLNQVLGPIREYFEKHPENLNEVEGLKITR
jgi:tyrosyl-tRNA synthetase